MVFTFPEGVVRLSCGAEYGSVPGRARNFPCPIIPGPTASCSFRTSSRDGSQEGKGKGGGYVMSGLFCFPSEATKTPPFLGPSTDHRNVLQQRAQHIVSRHRKAGPPNWRRAPKSSPRRRRGIPNDAAVQRPPQHQLGIPYTPRLHLTNQPSRSEPWQRRAGKLTTPKIESSSRCPKNGDMKRK